MKIALFGASFNPPHLGHKALVKHLLQTQIFDEIWIIPTFMHAFQKKLETFEHRFKMCELNFENISPQIKILDFEKEINNIEGYSIHLIRFLKNKFPKNTFYWIMGSDTLAEKNKWKNFEEIEQKVEIYPIRRAGYEYSELPEISSTQVREAVKKKQALGDFLDAKVENYIKIEKLYE